MNTRATRLGLPCLVLMGVGMLTGCVSSSPRRQIVLVPVSVTEIEEDVTTPELAPRVLRLSDVSTPIAAPPKPVRYGSARDRAVAATYVAQDNPGSAVYLYRRLIEQHGRRYEVAFTRNAYHEALRCAWRAGDIALLKAVLREYGRKLDDFERTPEPRFVTGLRKYLWASRDDLAQAYARLDVRRLPVAYDVLKRDRAEWLAKHRNTVLALTIVVRDRNSREWDTGLLDRLVLAEANLLNGYVRADSQILLFKDAEQRAKACSRSTDTTSLAIAAAQVFVECSGVVSADGDSYLLGRDYRGRWPGR